MAACYCTAQNAAGIPPNIKHFEERLGALEDSNLLKKYKDLCSKVVTLMDNSQPEQVSEEDSAFLNGIYPFLDKLGVEEKFMARMLFQKALYKFAFDSEMNVDPLRINLVPQNERPQGAKSQNAKSRNGNSQNGKSKSEIITMYRSDEEAFYETMLAYLSNLAQDKKLAFRYTFMTGLYRIVYKTDPEGVSKLMQNDPKGTSTPVQKSESNNQRSGEMYPSQQQNPNRSTTNNNNNSESQRRNRPRNY